MIPKSGQADWIRGVCIKGWPRWREIEMPFAARVGWFAGLTCLLVASSTLRAAEESFVAPAKRAEQGWLVHSVESPLQRGDTEIKVLLPEQGEKDARRRVLYVLPVEADNGTRWGSGLAEIQKHGLHNRFQLIVVAPTFSDLPWYADHPTLTKIRQEEYFLKVVVPFIDRTYPTLASAEGRWLLGFSKSGWGAWSLLLRQPDVFGKAAAWDAPMMMETPDRFGMKEIVGTQENFDRYRITNLLRSRADSLAGKSPRLILTGFGNFHGDHEKLHAWLDQQKIPHVYRDGPKREHAWGSGWLTEAVELLAK